MATTLTAGVEVNDLPRLSLSLDLPPSSSPFPSPSSSFIPPPIPIAHEFAMRPPPPQLHAQPQHTNDANSDRSERTDGMSHEPSVDVTTSTSTTTPAPLFDDKNDKLDAAHDTPMPTPIPPPTPTMANAAQPSPKDELPPTTANDPRTPTTAAHPLPTKVNEMASHPPSNRSSLSLTSSRPAPPSPSLRRLSKCSARSSTSSLSLSLSLSRASSVSKRAQTTSRLSVTSIVADHEPQPEPPETQPEKRAQVPPLIKIRDFAFASEDERHEGLGPDVPKANKPKRINRWHYRMLHQRDSISSSDGDGEAEDDGDDGEGWAGMGWSFGGRFGWGTGIAGGQPSRMDFARNFVSDGDGEGRFFDAEDEEESGAEDEGEGEGEEEEEEGVELDLPLHPGLYRALYAFEPEGTAEMGLEEDQIVRVLGRGGGMGWAVVLRESAGPGEQTHALVPESYLEPVKLDHAEG